MPARRPRAIARALDTGIVLSLGVRMEVTLVTLNYWIGGSLRPMRPIIFLLSVALLASCSGGGVDEAESDLKAEPTTIAMQWIEAVASVNIEALDNIVEPVGLAVLAGVENVVSSSEMVGLIDGGFADELAIGYWTTFRDDFAAIRGGSIESLTVGSQHEIAGRDNYLGVDITLNETTGQLILRNVDGAWKVDMAATVGPALVGPLGDYLASALQGDNAAQIADAYLGSVVPGLETASAVDATNSDLVFEIEYLRQLSADAVASQP